MKKFLFLLLIISCSAFACSSDEDNTRDTDGSEIPLDIDRPSIADKPVQMWIDAHANFSRFAEKESITSYLKKMKQTGFNEVYVDVKPGIGYALYDSDILPPLTKWDTETVTRDWDYLAYWIEEAEKQDIKVIASLSVLGYGYTKTKEGVIYDDNRWDGKTQQEMTNAATPNNLVDMRDQTSVDAAMLNPCLPEVQSFVISVIEEIVPK